MLRRAALIASLGALSACYVGVPQDEGASEASAASTGAAASTAADATEPGATNTTATTGTAAATTSAVSEDMSSGTDTTAALTDPLTTGDDTTGTTTTLDTTTTDATTTDATTGEPPDPAALMCERWNSDRAQLGEGSWSGAVVGCDAGTLSADGVENALRLVNLYRHIAGLPPVTEDPTRTAKAQACALMMHANGQLSHTPPMNWKCWTAGGSGAAGQSNISSTPGVLGVDLYMVDPGNDTTIGHRRWILSNSLGPIGLGSTSDNSCMLVIGGGGDAGKPWLAWPPPGPVPYQAMHVPTIGWTHVDQTGWTIQSDSIDLSGAGVSVTVDGVEQPVAVNVLGKNYGSAQAIRFVPQGWTVEPGKTYDVALSGVAQPIAYSVQIVDCS
jgi:uncharacterized protein YkwD